MSGVGSTEEVAEPFQAPLDGPEGLPGLAVGELEVELLAVHGVLAEPRRSLKAQRAAHVLGLR